MPTRITPPLTLAKSNDVGLFAMAKCVKQMCDVRQGKTPKASPITSEQIEISELNKSYNVLKRIVNINKGYRALDVRLPEQFPIIGKPQGSLSCGYSLPCIRGSSQQLKLLLANCAIPYTKPKACAARVSTRT